MSRGSGRIIAAGMGFVAVVVLVASGSAGGQDETASAAKRPHRDRNTCLNDRIRHRKHLHCPDLQMRSPFALDRDVVNGTPVLRAANSIDNMGDGPAELVGDRSGARTMRARQKVYKRHGRIMRDTGANLYFKSIPGQGRYWKFKRAAVFRLFRLNKNGRRVDLVEVGPKQVYCLRDLEHTHPGLGSSPNNMVYPACSQSPNRQTEHLGTSVGWSDVYPSTYHENWIELNDIPKRACYAYVHEADPDNGIYERNERNNQSSTVVFLTRNGRWKPGRCRHVHDKALPPSKTADDTQVSDREPGGWGGEY